MITESYRKNKNRTAGGRMIKSCHSKGFTTMTIILLACSESMNSTTSLKFWDNNNKNNNNNNNDRSSSYQSSSTTTSSSPQTINVHQPFFSYISNNKNHRNNAVDDNNECPTYNNNESNNNCYVAPSPIIANIFRRKINNIEHADTSTTLSNYATSNRNLDSCIRECQNIIPRGGHLPANDIVSDILIKKVITTPYNIPLNGWKVIFQTLLTSLNVFCWLVPLKSNHITNNELALSLANAFSGGVFLSLAFGHLIPECVHGFAGNTNYNEATPYMLVLLGYLIIFFFEKVAFDAHDILHEMQHQHHTITNGISGKEQSEPTTAVASSSSLVSNGHHHHSTQKPEQHLSKPLISKDEKTSSSLSSATTTSTTATSSNNSGRGAVILLGALAVHSILEMMALGLSDTFNDSALLTLSISLHQPAESIALLIAFIKSGMSHDLIIKYLSIFSCMGPIGVLLGMIVKQYSTPIIDSCILAIVAGTFVYVGATEVIPEEWENSNNKWKKFISLMCGIISIYTITQYTMTLENH